MRGFFIVLAAVAALLSAAVASAGDVPPGFWSSARLAPAATFVAGKPIAVYCAKTQAALVAIANQSEAGVQDVQGVTLTIGGSDIYLSPLTCAYLNAWLNGKNVKNQYGVAGSMLTLAHEAEHAKGIADETDADCAALHAMPKMAAKFFPLKRRESLHDLMFDAWRGHSTKAAIYQTHPC